MRLETPAGPKLHSLHALWLLSFVTIGCARFGYDLAAVEQEANEPAAAGSSFQPSAPYIGGAGYTHPAGGDAGAGGAAGTSGAVSFAQRIAVPSYFSSDDAWTALTLAAPRVGIAILNPASGPGTSRDADIARHSSAARAAGISVLGYVPTQYGTRSRSEIEREIADYVAWYAVSGVFIDQSPADCALVPYYAALSDYMKNLDAAATVVLSPGRTVPECFASVADILVTYQNTSAAYEDFVPAGWEARYPAEHFWHLIYGARREDVVSVIALARMRGVGWVYVTPDVPPNPWDTLPTGAYWDSELAAVGR